MFLFLLTTIIFFLFLFSFISFAFIILSILLKSFSRYFYFSASIGFFFFGRIEKKPSMGGKKFFAHETLVFKGSGPIPPTKSFTSWKKFLPIRKFQPLTSELPRWHYFKASIIISSAKLIILTIVLLSLIRIFLFLFFPHIIGSSINILGNMVDKQHLYLTLFFIFAPFFFSSTIITS